MTDAMTNQLPAGADEENATGFDGAVARAEVEAQLESILQDPEFERNRSVSAFLKFVVEETLEGRGPRLKAFTVATAVFGRDANFDAQNNSIVRVQAARLRQLLQVYYAGPGVCDPIRIAMPLGGYAVKFEKRLVDDSLQSETAPEDAIEVPHALAAAPSPQVLLLLVVAVASVFGGFVLMLHQPAPHAFTPGAFAAIAGSPILVLSDRGATDKGEKDLALNVRLRDAIRRGISASDNVQVVQPSMESGETASPLSYSLTMDSGTEDNGKLWFSFELLHKRSGGLIWSQAFSEVEPTNAGVEPVGTAVVRAIGDVYGAISVDALSRSKSEMEQPRGYFCFLAAFDFTEVRTREKQIKARDCLELEIAENPDDARLLALLSSHLIRRYLDALPDSLGGEDLRRASELARRAYDRAPQRVRPIYALFLTRFYEKRFDEAFIAAEKVLEINPNLSVMTAQIGAAYVTRGQYDRGEALLGRTAKMEQPTPRIFDSFLMLSAYMRGDDEKFLKSCRYASRDGDPLGLLLQIASCNRTHDPKSAARATAILREASPGVAADIPAALDRYGFTPEIQAKLLFDLADTRLDSAIRANDLNLRR